MWELDHKQGWTLKNWCFWTDMLEKTLENPLACRKIKPVNNKRIFIGRTDAEAEAPILWSPDAKSWLIRKDPDAGKDWGRKTRGQQRIRWLDGITNSMGMSLSKLREMMKDREAWHAAIHGITKSHTWLHNWTTTTKIILASIAPMIFFKTEKEPINSPWGGGRNKEYFFVFIF